MSTFSLRRGINKHFFCLFVSKRSLTCYWAKRIWLNFWFFSLLFSFWKSHREPLSQPVSSSFYLSFFRRPPRRWEEGDVTCGDHILQKDPTQHRVTSGMWCEYDCVIHPRSLEIHHLIQGIDIVKTHIITYHKSTFMSVTFFFQWRRMIFIGFTLHWEREKKVKVIDRSRESLDRDSSNLTFRVLYDLQSERLTYGKKYSLRS